MTVMGGWELVLSDLNLFNLMLNKFAMNLVVFWSMMCSSLVVGCRCSTEDHSHLYLLSCKLMLIVRDQFPNQ